MDDVLTLTFSMQFVQTFINNFDISRSIGNTVACKLNKVWHLRNTAGLTVVESLFAFVSILISLNPFCTDERFLADEPKWSTKMKNRFD